MEDGKVYCSYDGFAWVWSEDQNKWLINLHLSGGPPSPHEKSPNVVAHKLDSPAAEE